MTKPKPSRTRWRFALAVVVVFAAVAWLVAFPAYEQHKAIQHRMAIQEIERVGGEVIRKTVGPQWLGQWGIGFDRVNVVGLRGTEITDDGLKHLSSLTSLSVLFLGDTEITDDGLKHLR